MRVIRIENNKWNDRSLLLAYECEAEVAPVGPVGGGAMDQVKPSQLEHRQCGRIGLIDIEHGVGIDNRLAGRATRSERNNERDRPES